MRGSFLTVQDRKPIVSNLNPVPYETDEELISIIKVKFLVLPTKRSLRSVGTFPQSFCSDCESCIPSEFYFGSSSLDGALSGF